MIRTFNGKRPRIAASAFVSEAAYVVGDVEIHENASIWPGAVIRADFGKIVVGKRSSLEDNCVVHGEGALVIGDDVIVGHGAVVHGESIGHHVLVGNKATVLDGVRIGNYCIIGAGSMIPPGMRVPDKKLVMGIPARIKGSLNGEQIARLK